MAYLQIAGQHDDRVDQTVGRDTTWATQEVWWRGTTHWHPYKLHIHYLKFQHHNAYQTKLKIQQLDAYPTIHPIQLNAKSKQWNNLFVLDKSKLRGYHGYYIEHI